METERIALESARTGATEGAVRGQAEAFDAGGGCQATEGDRPSGTAVTFGARRARGWRDGSRVAGSGIESQAADLVRAEDSDPGTAAVCGLWADPGRGARKRFLEFWPFRNPPTSNSR